MSRFFGIGLILLGTLFVSPGGVALAAPYAFTPLGELGGGSFFSVAGAVSADGSVVVGKGVTAAGE